MTFQPPIRSTGSVPTIPREPKKHACGLCRNPFTGGREDCPNNVSDFFDLDLSTRIVALARKRGVIA